MQEWIYNQLQYRIPMDQYQNIIIYNSDTLHTESEVYQDIDNIMRKASIIIIGMYSGCDTLSLQILFVYFLAALPCLCFILQFHSIVFFYILLYYYRF